MSLSIPNPPLCSRRVPAPLPSLPPQPPTSPNPTTGNTTTATTTLGACFLRNGFADHRRKYPRFYLPVSALSDSSALDSLLEQAARAGFNAAVFDLKDETGILHYASATELAGAGEQCRPDALSLSELKELAQRMRDKELLPPRLFAFKDRTALRSDGGPHRPARRTGLDVAGQQQRTGRQALAQPLFLSGAPVYYRSVYGTEGSGASAA